MPLGALNRTARACACVRALAATCTRVRAPAAAAHPANRFVTCTAHLAASRTGPHAVVRCTAMTSHVGTGVSQEPKLHAARHEHRARSGRLLRAAHVPTRQRAAGLTTREAVLACAYYALVGVCLRGAHTRSLIHARHTPLRTCVSAVRCEPHTAACVRHPPHAHSPQAHSPHAHPPHAHPPHAHPRRSRLSES